MRYLILFMVLVGIFVVGSRSCNGFHFGFGGVRGEGPVKTESRTASDFHAVSVEIPGLVEVSVSDRYSVEVQAQENILPLLKTEVENGKLRLYFEENVSQTKDLKVRISAPSFDELAIGGSGTIKTLSTLNGERLKLSIGGSGDIDVPQAEVGNMECSIAGSGNIRVGGKTGDVQFEIAGSGDIAAKELVATTGKVAIAGSGSVTCNVSQTLKASIAGSGDVYYTGAPSVDTDVSGSGKVKKVD
jgi:hypothetical protein